MATTRPWVGLTDPRLSGIQSIWFLNTPVMVPCCSGDTQTCNGKCAGVKAQTKLGLGWPVPRQQLCKPVQLQDRQNSQRGQHASGVQRALLSLQHDQAHLRLGPGAQVPDFRDFRVRRRRLVLHGKILWVEDPHLCTQALQYPV